MSVGKIDTFVLDFSDPRRGGGNPERSQVSTNYSFELVDNNNIRTLSTNGASNGDDIEGLLYVPDLPPNDPCRNVSGQYIPSNATRLADLPSSDYPYIAFAPWINAECTLAFLNAAPADSDAFLTYLPGNSTDVPPPLVSPVWNLNDGGSTWAQLKFPVYAIPSASGGSIMQQMAFYSGNLSTAPNANILEQYFAPTDYVRLYSTFDTGYASHYPTLWAFLLIILGIVLLLVGTTSCAMHYKQRRNRNDLRRRVLAGEVDLQSLGLAKPPRIAQSDIDALPLVNYTASEEKPSLPLDNLPPPSKSATSPHDYNQPTCPICLDDFTPGKTTVRTLPCHHIYHPACIDPHLLSSSSLCPVCKARVPSALDRASANGANPTCVTVPEITNAMVRRERHMRMIRERRAAEANPESNAQWFHRRFGRPLLPIVGRGMREELAPRRRTSLAAAAPATEPTASQIEMGSVSVASELLTSPPLAAIPGNVPSPALMIGAHVAPITPSTPRPPPSDTEGRREWARRRASALLHRQSSVHPSGGPIDIEEEERQRIAAMPRWRKVVGSVFPGFRN